MATRIFETPSVLLVIDAQAERDMFAEALRAAGYRTIKAATGIAAIQIAATTPPGIIVTDVRRLSGIVPATAAQIKNGGAVVHAAVDGGPSKDRVQCDARPPRTSGRYS